MFASTVNLQHFPPAVARLDGGHPWPRRSRHTGAPVGSSKYVSGRTLKVLLDLITVALHVGLCQPAAACFRRRGTGDGGGWRAVGDLSYRPQANSGQSIGNRPLLLLAVLLVILGVQMVSMGCWPRW